MWVSLENSYLSHQGATNIRMNICADSLEHSMLACTKPGYRLRFRQKIDLLRKHMRLQGAFSHNAIST